MHLICSNILQPVEESQKKKKDLARSNLNYLPSKHSYITKTSCNEDKLEQCLAMITFL